MGSHFYKKWLTLFLSTVTREGTSKSLRYCNNWPRLNSTSKNAFKDKMKGGSLSEKVIKINKRFYELDIPELIQILLEDMSIKNDKYINLLINPMKRNSSRNHNIANLQKISPLFLHPLKFSYMNSRNKKDTLFSFVQTLKLEMSSGHKVIDNVIWPNTMFSNSCRGIGVTPELYDELLNNPSLGHLNPHNMAIDNPTTDMPLKIYTASFVPVGYRAIGLFPQFVEEHRTCFKGLEYYGSLIKSNYCSINEISKVNKRIDGLFKTEMTTHLPKSIPEVEKPELRTISELLRISKKVANFGNNSIYDHEGYQCDAIRSTLLSNKVTTLQLQEEVFKNYILFNVFTVTMKMKQRARNFNILGIDKVQQYIWKPWDYYILNEIKELENIAFPKSLNEVMFIKQKFDFVIAELHSYSQIVISEQKLNPDLFYEGEGDLIPRALPILAVLEHILKKSKYIGLFQPNLQRYLNNNKTMSETIEYKPFPDLNILEQEDLRTIIENGKFCHSMIFEIMEMEEFTYKVGNSINKITNLEKLSDNLKWQIVIVLKDDINYECKSILLFSTKITTTILNNPESIPRFKNFTCVQKKMIDEKGIIYLYKKDETESDGTKISIKNIVDMLKIK